MNDKKQYCFISNYLTPHQLPFCLEMEKKTEGNFVFIETEKLPEERVKLGYPNYGDKYDFVVKAIKDKESFSRAMQIAYFSDVVIIGSASDSFIKKRLKENKLTFRFSERIFKKRYYDFPRWLKYTLKNYKYRNKNLFYLLSSAYAPHDYKRCGVKREKMFKWGYFPKVHSDSISCDNRIENSCVWVGRFLDLKHAEDAINAVIKLNSENYSVSLDIIGTGEKEENLKNLVNIKNAKSFVNFLGSMPNEEVYKYLLQAQIFLFTSDYNEGWGAVLNEAMDSGLAVVASHAIGSVPFLIEHGKNGLIYEYGKENALYENLKSLLDDNNKVKEFSENAVQTMLKEWNAKNATEKLINFCNCFFDGEIEKGICQSGVLSRAQAIPQKKMYKEITKGN